MSMSSHPSPGTPNTSTSSTPTTISQARYPSLKPCSHLAQVLSSNARDTVLRNYGLAVKVANFSRLSSTNLPHLKSKKNEKSRLDKPRMMRLKSVAVRCKDCSDSIGGTFMCLQCPHVGCWEKKHFVNHAKQQGHIFGIDGQSGHLFCFKCGDYTSHSELEAMRLKMTIKSADNDSDPEEDEEELVAKYTRLINFKPTTGLRGFVNMGATCFMSSVMQTFIHNPIIRDYFMTEGHMSCRKGRDECITCAVDQIFTEFYTSNKTSGFGPVSLLNAAWRTNKSLAGYSEQDAHEFWQFMVEQLHQALHITGQEPQSPCSCIVHRTFSSDLLSTITCTQCDNVTSTVDPIIDISLGITQAEDLMTCLRNFTKKEKLDIKYNCSHCHERTQAMKQLSIKKFPNTLAIQLKRFEHNAQSVKLEKYISFPLFMNMSEFSSTCASKGTMDSRLTYELFGVVCHIGSVNTGHYVVVIKNNQGQWFKFDDSVVTLMAVEQVLQIKAYLLFYMVHKL